MKKFSIITLSLVTSMTALFAVEDMVVNITEGDGSDYYVFKNPVGLVEQNVTVNMSGGTFGRFGGIYYDKTTADQFDGANANFTYNITGGSIRSLDLGYYSYRMRGYYKKFTGDLTADVSNCYIKQIYPNFNSDVFTGNVYINIHEGAEIEKISTPYVDSHIGTTNLYMDGGKVGNATFTDESTITLVGNTAEATSIGATKIYIGTDSQAYSGTVSSSVVGDEVYISKNSVLTTNSISYSRDGSKLYVDDNASVIFTGGMSYTRGQEWNVSSSANISVIDNKTVKLDFDSNFTLNILLAEDFDSTSLNLSDIFEDTITFSGTMDETNFSLLDHNGNKLEGFELTKDETGAYIINNIVVPEPAAYAAIFGALALAFAAYRRRK